MRARHWDTIKSVSPIRDKAEEIMANECDSDGDNEDIICEPCGGDIVERVSKERDEENVKKMIDPKLPSDEEVRDHYRFHIPYRNWCPICIKSKGRDADHRITDRDRTVSEYCLDYCFPGDEFGFKLTVLVGKERLTKNWMATAVPTKGASGKFGVDKVLEFFEELGDKDRRIILKND